MISIEELTVEIARQRDVLKRIESLVWYQPDDDDDLVEAVRAMARERDEARAEVERLRRERDHERTVANEQLARAHDAVRERDEAREECAELRDYAETVGLQAVIDASGTYKVVVGERDIAEAEVERLRAEVERMRAALAQAQRADE